MALAIRPADILKVKVIDYLITNFDDVVIGNEVMYGSSRKLVDLLALYQGKTYAIEIKSEKDDLRRLPDQILEYSKIFDHTLVFTTEEHIKKIRRMLQKRVSFFCVAEDGSIEGELIDKQNFTLKSEMLATMNSSFIRRRLNVLNAADSDQIRLKALKHKKEEIHSILFDYFMEKLGASYRLFLEERVEKTEIDDIYILSTRLNVE